MFRAAFRGAYKPLRANVCLLCSAHRSATPATFRQLHHTPILRSEASTPKPVSENTPVDTSSIAQTPADPKVENSPPGSPATQTPSTKSKKSKSKKKAKGKAPAKDPVKPESDQQPSSTKKISKGKAFGLAMSKRKKKSKAKKTTETKAAQTNEPAKPNQDESPEVKQEDKALNPDQQHSEANSSDTLPESNGVPDSSKPQDNRRAIHRVTEILNRGSNASKELEAAIEKPIDQSLALKSRMKGLTKNREEGVVTAEDTQLTALDLPEFPTAPVPGLSYGLDRVLFNPGVYHLRDPRSRVYNFDPYLGSIMPVDEFDFDLLKEYITSSRDETLKDLSAAVDKKYRGSSSSMTAVLAHFHFLLSSWRPVDTRMLSQGFSETLRSFAKYLRAPAAVILHYNDGRYAVDADKEYDTGNILMELGKSMEKLLTMPKEEFERYRRTHQNKISAQEEENMPESYHYSTVGNFAMRSQLDAYDPRLPGTGMFDLKTRAVSSIRADARNFEDGLGYEIRSQFGLFESYEREYYDMIRAAFLKYSLQVRIGRMNGIFVAHHNIERIFGFQYISLSEMDLALHGQADTNLGDREFQISMDLWSKLMDKATERFPEQTLRFHFEARVGKPNFMYIFAEPVTKAQIEEIQRKSKAELEEYRNRILNLDPGRFGKKDETPAIDPSEAEDPHEFDFAAAEQTNKRGTYKGPLHGMILTVKNFVNGVEVERPNLIRGKDEWKVEYELCEMSEEHIHNAYHELRERRRRDLDKGENDGIAADNFHKSRLQAISKRGQEYRKIQDKLDERDGITVYGEA